MPTYYTHDNGGRPFKVVIRGSGTNRRIKVYSHNPENLEEYKPDAIQTFSPEKVWVGKSPRNRMTEFSGGYGSEFDGNSLLLKVKNESDHYIFIGERIFRFRSLDPIRKFVSPVGNNDVPYPYAIDSEKRYYLMIEDVILGKVPEEYVNDPYDYFYRADLITPDIGRIPPQQPMMANFRGIEKLTIGGEHYTMRYVPRPHKDYDRIAKWDDFGEGIRIHLQDGTSQKLNRKQYIELMNAFGREMDFRPLKGVKLLTKLDY